MMDVPSQAL
jgi:transposase